MLPAAMALAAALLASGCSSDDASSEDPESSPTSSQSSTTNNDANAGVTTPPDPNAVDSLEFYRSVGFTDEEAQCLADSPLDADVIAEETFGEDHPMAVHFEGATAPVVVRSGAMSVTEVERQILEELAAMCAPGDKLDALAELEGGALEREILDEMLPAYLEAREADGATTTELQCLEFGFRAFPARLGTVAANPLAVERECGDDARRAQWRDAALRRGFADAELPQETVDCLVGSTADLNAVEVLVEELAYLGDIESDPAELGDLSCGDADDLVEIATDIVEHEADFGVERIGVS